jgi:hypothetical protein
MNNKNIFLKFIIIIEIITEKKQLKYLGLFRNYALKCLSKKNLTILF